MQWQAIGCSEIGVGHLKTGTPCQDNCAKEIISNDRVVIGAVSDGMGSAAHSDLGSEIAVNTAIFCLSKNDWLNRHPNTQEARSFFESLLKTVVTKIETEAKDQGYSVRDLACTLLAFVATPDWLAAMQVGDGAIVIRPQGRETYQLLFMPQKGEYANETVPVTSSKASQEMQCQVIKESIAFICAATDGIEHISLVKGKYWKAYDDFFEPLERQIMRSNKSIVDKKKVLRDWLSSEEVNQRTDDDKTVLLCVQNGVNDIKILNKKFFSSKEPHQPQTFESISKENRTADIVSDYPSTVEDKLNEIKQEISQLIYNKYPYVDIKFRIRRKTLEIFCVSKRSLDKARFLPLLKSVDYEQNIVPIRKIIVINQNTFNSQAYWKEEISENLGEFDILTIIKISTTVILMTLICVLIKKWTNEVLAILAYFIYNAILIAIFDPFAKKQ